MPPIDHRTILDQAQALARHQPDTEATDQALELTRAAILHAQAARRQQKRHLMRMTVFTGIAACLIAATGVVWMTHFDRTASAAEELQQAVQAGSAYKGWIHSTVDVPSYPQNISGLDGASPPTHSVVHTNTIDGTSAEVIEYAGGLDITMIFPGAHETANYSAKSNEIRWGTLRHDAVKSPQNNVAPTTVGELVALFKEQLGRDPYSVTETPEGDLKRYDITFFASDADAAKFRHEHPGFNGLRWMVIWVNRDKMMTRVKNDQPTGTMTVNITYGPPVIHDIYDLGAPRTAKVIDERLKEDVKTLMARLDRRAAKGIGDYAALLSNYHQDADGTVTPDYGYVTLYAAKGDKRLAFEYHIVSAGHSPPEIPMPKKMVGRNGSPIVELELPPQWPAPDIAQLLPVLRTAHPVQFYIKDSYSSSSSSYTVTSGVDPHARPAVAGERQLKPGDGPLGLGPTSEQAGIGFPGTTADFLQDQAHPGLVGLHCKRVPTPQTGTTFTTETTWWLDPARNDVPVEESWTFTGAGQDQASVVTHVHFAEYAQLPNGLWYATQWREDRTARDALAGEDQTYTSYYRLQIFPLMKLDDSWFTDPFTPITTAPASLP